jgi:hypothetical protein
MQYVSITKTSQVLHSMEIISVYSENHTKYNLKQVVHVVCKWWYNRCPDDNTLHTATLLIVFNCRSENEWGFGSPDVEARTSFVCYLHSYVLHPVVDVTTRYVRRSQQFLTF